MHIHAPKSSLNMRVHANIVYSVTRAHACQVIAIHACTRTLLHAITCVFPEVAFDWEGNENQVIMI